MSVILLTIGVVCGVLDVRMSITLNGLVYVHDSPLQRKCEAFPRSLLLLVFLLPREVIHAVAFSRGRRHAFSSVVPDLSSRQEGMVLP